MAEFTSEQIEALKNAQSLEELTALLKADGQDESAAEEAWTELEARRASECQELSLDELESVTGGARDWLTEGCAATVEPGSDCWGTDGGCAIKAVKYDNAPVEYTCPQCGANPVGIVYFDYNRSKFKCRCGHEFFM